jgi:hypothetical protein
MKATHWRATFSVGYNAGMKLRYSIKSILIFTAILAVVAAVCAAIPTFEFRDLGLPIRSLIPRRPTLAEAAIRFAWTAPIVSFLEFMSIRRQKKLRALRDT